VGWLHGLRPAPLPLLRLRLKLRLKLRLRLPPPLHPPRRHDLGVVPLFALAVIAAVSATACRRSVLRLCRRRSLLLLL